MLFPLAAESCVISTCCISFANNLCVSCKVSSAIAFTAIRASGSFLQCSFKNLNQYFRRFAHKNTVRFGKTASTSGACPWTISTSKPPSFCLFCAISCIASVLRSTAKTAPSIAFRAKAEKPPRLCRADVLITVSPAARAQTRDRHPSHFLFGHRNLRARQHFVPNRLKRITEFGLRTTSWQQLQGICKLRCRSLQHSFSGVSQNFSNVYLHAAELRRLPANGQTCHRCYCLSVWNVFMERTAPSASSAGLRMHAFS